MSGALEELNEQGGVNQTVKDLFSGAVGGIAQVLIGMLDDPIFHSCRWCALRKVLSCYNTWEDILFLFCIR